MKIAVISNRWSEDTEILLDGREEWPKRLKIRQKSNHDPAVTFIGIFKPEHKTNSCHTSWNESRGEYDERLQFEFSHYEVEVER